TCDCRSPWQFLRRADRIMGRRHSPRTLHLTPEDLARPDSPRFPRSIGEFPDDAREPRFGLSSGHLFIKADGTVPVSACRKKRASPSSASKTSGTPLANSPPDADHGLRGAPPLLSVCETAQRPAMALRRAEAPPATDRSDPGWPQTTGAGPPPP